MENSNQVNDLFRQRTKRANTVKELWKGNERPIRVQCVGPHRFVFIVKNNCKG